MTANLDAGQASLSEARCRSTHNLHPCGIGGVGAKEPVSGVRNPVEELGTAYGIVARAGCDDRTQLISFQFKILGIGPCPEGRTNLFRRLDSRCIRNTERCKTRQDNCSNCCVLLGTAKMAQNMVCRLVTHHEGQFIGITDGCDKRKVESKDRSSAAIHCLKRVGRLARAIIDDDLKIAVRPRRKTPAFALCDWFDRFNDGHELTCRHPGSGAGVLLRDLR